MRHLERDSELTSQDHMISECVHTWDLISIYSGFDIGALYHQAVRALT
jgi:hypothetical protein